MVQNLSIQFPGENEVLLIDKEGYSILYDSKKFEIEYRMQDRFLSSDNSLFRGSVSRVDSDLLRFKENLEKLVPNETIISLYHGRYLAPGIVVLNCNNVHLDNIIIYHALGIGVLAERCENLYFNQVNMVPNRAKNRVFSGLADAFHLVSNKGRYCFIKLYT